MRKLRRNQNHIVDFFFTLSLFCLFAASALIVVLIGSGVYKNTTAHMEENFATRTALSYVAEKVRQHDTAGGVTLLEEGDGGVLVLTDTVNDGTYETYIYAYDGCLCELVIKEGTGFSREQGEQILKVDTFSLEAKPGDFLQVTAADSGSSPVSCLLHLRSTADTDTE